VLAAVLLDPNRSARWMTASWPRWMPIVQLGAGRSSGRELRFTDLGKELFPARTGEGPVTKAELPRYDAQLLPPFCRTCSDGR
jgi:hypothetical protein